jgi:CRISPR-associated protein Cmr3
VYCLNDPQRLFQDEEKSNGNVNKVHTWRKLGYSELLWIPYAPTEVSQEMNHESNH